MKKGETGKNGERDEKWVFVCCKGMNEQVMCGETRFSQLFTC